MFAVTVDFRDEDGQAHRGELVNPFKIMMEPTGQVLHIAHEDTFEVDVMISDGEALTVHRIPLLAVVKMREVAFA